MIRRRQPLLRVADAAPDLDGESPGTDQPHSSQGCWSVGTSSDRGGVGARNPALPRPIGGDAEAGSDASSIFVVGQLRERDAASPLLVEPRYYFEQGGSR